MAYIFLAGSIICSTVLGLTYKISDKLRCDRPTVNLTMFTAALAGAGIYAAFVWRGQTAPAPIALAIVMGLLGSVNIMAFRIAATKGRISTSWTILQLSMVIPILASILLWHEIPKPKHFVGFCLAALAIVLLGVDMARSKE